MNGKKNTNKGDNILEKTIDLKQSKADQHKAQKKQMTSEQFYEQELPTVAKIVMFNNNLPMSLYSDSTGVKSPEVVFRGLNLSKNRLISEQYLLNFKRSQADLGVVIGVNNYKLPEVVSTLVNRDKEEEIEDRITLPPYQKVRAPIGSVIRSRRSIRHYSGQVLKLTELSTLLYYANGISGSLPVEGIPETASLGKSDKIELRNSVSGGGLYPLRLYVFALNVENLAPAIYRYMPKHHALKKEGAINDVSKIADLAQFGDIEIDKANFMLVYVYRLFENSRKYGEAGMAFAFIEAGSISSNVHLISTALNIGSCDVGGFSKNKFEKMLHADGITSHMIHLTVLGK